MANKDDPTILEIKNVSKRFENLIAVNDVSISLERGKLITFLGPSGCGKTTLLRTISGFTEPDAGEIILDGMEITALPPNQRDTAMVFQNYALFPHMTVAQNIGFGLRIRKRKRQQIDAEVERLLDLVQMEGLGDRKPHELSGGQQQRVALARALSLHPKILLLDEPLSNLDANLRISMREEVRKLQRRLDLTIIFVTHDQEEAMSISDLLVVMDHGIVKQIGPPTEVYENPIDEFVADFIGHVNFFPGEVFDLSGDLMTFEISQGKLQLEMPPFPVSVGDKLRAVVRPESIDIVASEKEVTGTENVMEGLVEGAMYIGSIMRFTITAGGQTIYVDEADPQYRGMFGEGQEVKLILRNRIHLLKD